MIPRIFPTRAAGAPPTGASASLLHRAPLAVSILAAAGLAAAGAAGAQDSAAPPHAAHPHAHAQAKQSAPQGAGSADLKAQASYSLGVLMGTQLHQFGLNESQVDFHKVEQGLRDVVSGKASPSAADEQKVQELIRKSRSAAAEKNEAAARRFLADNAKRPGVRTTASGLQYKVLSPGSGAEPQPTDEVTVNYRGTLLDGTQFDSSYERGKPATFPVNGVIKGWQEALVLMKPGAKWQLFIPPELAYGENSRPPIPPNSLLKFDVELLSVKPQSAKPNAGAAPDAGGGAEH